MIYKRPIDCNRCDAKGCKGAGTMTDMKACLRYINPDGKFMLAECALAHPTSLNEALSALPFEVNLNFYLK